MELLLVGRLKDLIGLFLLPDPHWSAINLLSFNDLR